MSSKRFYSSINITSGNTLNVSDSLTAGNIAVTSSITTANIAVGNLTSDNVVATTLTMGNLRGGNIDINGIINNKNYIQISTTNGVSSVLSSQNGPFFSIEAFTTGNTAKLPILLAPWGGNVGIGSINATSATLHVQSPATPGSYGFMNTSSGMVANDQLLSFIGRTTTSPRNGYFNWYHHKGDGSSDSTLRWDVFGKDYILVLRSNGYVGIGVATPAYPLHVHGTQDTGSVGSYAGYYNVYGWQNQTVNYAASLYTNGFIVAGTGFASFSDSRIKSNIVDIDDVSALETLRQIQPKRYNYIDVVQRGTSPVWGFISQQVGSVLEYSTNTITDFIPNVYDKAIVSKHTDNSTLLTLCVKQLDFDMTDNATMRLRLYTMEDNVEKIVTIKSILSSNSFTIEEDNLELNEYFVFGQEVKDFHTLDKNAIYTVAVAALQEVDKELQDTKSELSVANATILSQQNEINELRSEIALIKAHLGLN